MLYNPLHKQGFIYSDETFTLADAGVLVSPALIEIAALIGAVPSPVAVLDRRGQMVLVSDAWRHFPHEGMLTSHLIGENFVEGCSRAPGPLIKDAHEVSAGIQAVLEGELPRFSREYAYVSPDQQRWTLLQAAPIHGGLQGAVVELTDITARKQVEAVARDRQRAIEDRDRAESQQHEADDAVHRMELFVSLAAHESRTPLSVMKSYLAGADRRVATYMAEMEAGASDSEALSEIQEGIQGARQAALQMGGLLDDLLQASRARAGKLVVEPKHTDLIALVRHVVAQQRQLHPASRLRLHTRHMSKLMLRVDPDRITQVLNNLLDNAWKYASQHRPVDVSVEGSGAVVRVAVQDRGPGLAHEEQGRVWDCYYQSSSVQLQPGQHAGLGLGLYLARQILEQHGGHVGVESTLGEGSTFWFTLPHA
jgi:signal transduction histidine kinase